MKSTQNTQNPKTRKQEHEEDVFAAYKGFETGEKAAKRRAQEAESGDFFKFAEGTTTIRVLPVKADSGLNEPFAVVEEHWVDNPVEPGKRVRIVCPRKAGLGACLICEHDQALRSTGSPVDAQEAAKLKPAFRAYISFVVRGQDGEDDSPPKIAGVGKSIYTGLNECLKLYGDFSHPAKGYDVHITRKGMGPRDTEYSVSAARSDSPLHPDFDQALGILEAQPDLSLFTVVTPYEKMVEIMGELPAPRQTRGPVFGASSRSQRALPAGSSKARKEPEVIPEDDEIPF